MFDEKVVVRFLDGSTLKAFGDNFLPGETEVMVRGQDEKLHTVSLDAVKLICFVRAFTTDSQSTHRPPPPLLFQAVPGRRVTLEFSDGEVVEGMATLQQEPQRGFFVTPLNPHSNNIQIYVNPKALKRFRFSS